MDYAKIAEIAQAACLDVINTAVINKDKSAEMQAKVFTAGIVAAIQEYERQKSE